MSGGMGWDGFARATIRALIEELARHPDPEGAARAAGLEEEEIELLRRAAAGRRLPPGILRDPARACRWEEAMSRLRWRRWYRRFEIEGALERRLAGRAQARGGWPEGFESPPYAAERLSFVVDLPPEPWEPEISRWPILGGTSFARYVAALCA